MTPADTTTFRRWSKNTRETGLVEIVCPHGVGHPSKRLTPRKTWQGWMLVHGCDGCCASNDFWEAERWLRKPGLTRQRKSCTLKVGRKG